MILVVAHKDIPIRMLLQLRWQAHSDWPKQAIRLILRYQLCQEHVPRRVVHLGHPRLSVPQVQHGALAVTGQALGGYRVHFWDSAPLVATRKQPCITLTPLGPEKALMVTWRDSTKFSGR